MSPGASTAAPRALVIALTAPGASAAIGGGRTADLIELLRRTGWAVSFASATGLGDPYDTSDLRQAGIPAYDGAGADFERVIAGGRYELTLCAGWQVAELCLPTLRRAAPASAVIVDAPLIQSVRDAQRFLDLAGGAGGRLGAEYGSEMTGEINVYAQADAVLTGTAAEAELVNTLLGTPRAVCVPDVAWTDSPQAPAPARKRTGIVVAGALPDPDCIEAATSLQGALMPLIERPLRERHPLLVLGSPGLDGVAAWPGALVGADPLATLGRARVAVMPLRRAVDRRLIVLALQAGAPLVITPAAAYGLPLHHRRDALIADTTQELAQAIERLLREEALCDSLSLAGSATMRGSHGSDRVTELLRGAIELAFRRHDGATAPAEGRRTTFAVRVRREENRRIGPSLRRAIGASARPEDRILVLGEGSEDLLRIGRENVVHFPPLGETGMPLVPADSEQAVALLEREIRAGADLLVIPSTTADWLQGYPGFEQHLRERYELIAEPSCTIVRLGVVESRALTARLIAFYLPQFHPIDENDRAWGAGFTEWRNVGCASPLFDGHYQPHVPGELGFYDLRLAETRQAQAELARQAGIHAFCYYHYWFGGRRLLGRPLEEMLASGEPDFPFCLCWANESWSRRWDGSDDEVIQPQMHSLEDDQRHIRWLIPALGDRRAVTVDGKPLFLVYHAKNLPDPSRTADLWRREVRDAGLAGLHLVAVETEHDRGWDATRHGFDAKLIFQPRFSLLRSLPQLRIGQSPELRVWDYRKVSERLGEAEDLGYRCYETVCTGWDNSPRRGREGWILHDATPQAYGRWLKRAIERVQRKPADQRLVFINAWNEWAEGAHLEPDLRHGRDDLDATAAAVARSGRVPADAPDGLKARDRAVPSPRLSVRRVSVPPAVVPLRRARAIAFYLPQFHPTPENDEFWGPGFSEWTNLIQARPQFEGHRQPQVPAHLGYYDLRVPEVREAQAALARAHGIEGFCYWHYWFAGRRPLCRPLDEVLESGTPAFPFCLAWANEPWSRTWLGRETELLIEQTYSPEDDLAHARWLAGVFADPRYLRVSDRPVFLVYRPRALEDPLRFTELLRQECARGDGSEPLLLGTTAWDGLDHRTLGFDGTVEFEPKLDALGDPFAGRLTVHDYQDARDLMKAVRGFPVYPSVMVGWDNTPRRGQGATILTGSTPGAFRAALQETIAGLANRVPADRLLFINAWNEWGEGNRLEPERQHGLGYLQAVREVLAGEADSPRIYSLKDLDSGAFGTYETGEHAG
jgi:lipopolysaccharide biosynthesis protein